MHSRGQVSAVLLLPFLSFPDWTCTSNAPSFHEKEGAGPRVSWSSLSSLGLTGQAKNTSGFPEQKRQRTIQTSWSGVSTYSLGRNSSGELLFNANCFTVYIRKVLKRSRDGIKALEACYWILEATRWVRRFCLASRRVHTIWSICFERGMRLSGTTGVYVKRERILRHECACVQTLFRQKPLLIIDAFGLSWPLHLLTVCWMNTYCSDLISRPSTCVKSSPHKLIIREAMDKHRPMTQFPTSLTKFI